MVHETIEKYRAEGRKFSDSTDLIRKTEKGKFYKEIIMADVLIRNIDEKTLKNLKNRATENNRSLQAELKSLLELYAGPDLEESKSMVREIYEKYNAEGRTFSDSGADLSEDRMR